MAQLWIPGYAGAGGGPDVGPVGEPESTIDTNLNITSAGTHVYENVRFTAGVSMSGTAVRNITFRNCWIENAGGFWCVDGPEWDSNATLTIEDCLIGSDEGNGCQNGIGGTHTTVKRTKIIGCEDGIKAGWNSYYEQVHITDLRPRTQDAETAHSDGFQDPGATDYVLRWSNIDVANTTLTLPNSAILIKSDFNPIENVIIENCHLNGGGWIVDVSTGNYNPPTPPSNITIRNNAFGADSGFGLYSEGEGADVTWEGNYLAGTANCIDKDGNIIGSGCGPDGVCTGATLVNIIRGDGTPLTAYQLTDEGLVELEGRIF